MTHQTEKRSGCRHCQNAILSWAYFNSDKYFDAKMLNYSEGGLYFESDSAPLPKTGLYIRIEENLDETSKVGVHAGFRMMTLGEVRWCHKITDKDMIKYGIGVKYYAPEY
jgi:hypothetical protein